MTNILIDDMVANSVLGTFGSLAAIATKPPLSFREGIFRCISGLILAMVMTSYTAQWVGIDPTSYSKISAISCGLGFVGFHLLTSVMILLDAALAKVKETKLGVIPDLIDFIRGNRGEK